LEVEERKEASARNEGTYKWSPYFAPILANSKVYFVELVFLVLGKKAELAPYFFFSREAYDFFLYIQTQEKKVLEKVVCVGPTSNPILTNSLTPNRP